MRYGDLVTLQSDGVQIAPKELEPIGIYPGSDSWGVLLPDWDKRNAEQRPDNLLISPFMPCSWPILIRLVLRLWRPDGDQHRPGEGPLHKAAEVLARHGLNILSYDCTPTGYHHLTWTLVGEHEALRLDKHGILAQGRAWSREQRTLESTELLEYAQDHLAPAMLRYGRSLEQALLEANEEHEFLHPAFADDTKAFGGRIYDARRLVDDVRQDGAEQEIRPVRWRWLQDLAFFWLYGAGEENPLRIRYEMPSHSLKLDELADGVRYRRALTGCAPPDPLAFEPSRALALFDTDEQYVRVIPDRQCKVRVRVTYAVRFPEPPTTRGILRDVLHHLDAQGVNVLHVANSTREGRPESEVNSVDFIGVIKEGGEEAVNRLRRDLNATTVNSSPWLHDLTLEPGLITPRHLFVSTRFRWKRWNNSAVRGLIIRLALQYGFTPIILDNQEPSYRLPHLQQSFTGHYVLPETVASIQYADAFLQIIPCFLEATRATVDERLRWLNTELGVAVGRNLPHEVCLDPGLGKKIKDFKEVLLKGGYRIVEFESGADLEAELEPVFRGAIQRLATSLE